MTVLSDCVRTRSIAPALDKVEGDLMVDRAEQ